ncbi:MAG: hypothetical protein ACRD88_20135 [Terriglobia bacterium]
MSRKLISILASGIVLAAWLVASGAAAALSAGVLPNNQWELLAVAYPPDRDVSVTLGGAEKTLTSRGLCKVKWQNDAASMEIAIENLPSAQEAGWPGRQYILWAIDEEKRMLNLGPVSLSGRNAKWNVRVPVRVFALLVTAEQDPQAKTPSTAVVLESLLPTDRYLVVPVKRISVNLIPIQG